MNNESKRQELASRLVQREVFYCVSSLVGTLSTLVQNVPYEVQRSEGISWEDDIAPLMESTNYEEAGTQHINGCTDLDELETMADSVGYWSDAVNATAFESDLENPVEFSEWFEVLSDQDALYLAIHPLRNYIIDHVSDWEEFCRENDVDTDDYHDETYEFWLVSDWLAAKLKARGYVVGELCGLTIYARGCTGQSMCLDHNMQEIALELWGDEE